LPIHDFDIPGDAGCPEQGREIETGWIEAKADDLHERASPAFDFRCAILSGRAIKGSMVLGAAKLFAGACLGGHSPLM
jgi:hypothetical protein